MNSDDKNLESTPNKIGRRKFLQMSAMVGVGLTGLTGLAGCASTSKETSSTGTTNTAATGAAVEDSINPTIPGTSVKFDIPPSNGKKLRIGIAGQPTLAFWQRYLASCILRIEELGEEPVVVWTGPAFNENIIGIESLVQQEVDGIVLGGNNGAIFTPVLPSIEKKGIKAVAFETDPLPNIPLVEQNHAWANAMSIFAMLERLGGKGNIGVFTAPGIHITIDRAADMLKAILGWFPDIKVTEIPCRWPDAEKAGLEDVENMLRTGKKLDAIWSNFDGPLFGAVQAIKNAGLQDKMFVTTSSGDDHVFEALNAGDPVWEFAANADWWDMGRRVADMVVMSARGGKPPLMSHVNEVGVNRSNIAFYWKVVQEQNRITDETLKRFGKK